MADPARRDRTFDELYAEIQQLAEGLTGEILEPGLVHVMSRPGKRHRRAVRGCLSSLSGHDANVGGTGWWIEIEAEIRLGDRLVVPDLAGWRVARVPDLPDENPIAIAPDWCCEVLSPRTARDDRQLKLPLYARSAIPFTWLIDPELKLVELYQTMNDVPALVATARDEDRRVLPPFEHELALQRWWLSGPPTTE